MARSISARAPSQNAYKGSVGQTQTETVHVTSARGGLIVATVYTTIDAVSDPELVERLYADSLNTLRADGEAFALAVPVVYHDPAAEVFALVLGEPHRHRELDERIRLLERLRDDRVGLPRYVKEFAVVFGHAGLRAYLEHQAQQLLSQRETTKEQDRRRAELSAREAELQRAQHLITQQQAELGRSKAELERHRAELERSQTELERNRSELERMRAEARARVIAAVQTTAEPTTISPVPSPPEPEPERDEPTTKPVTRQDINDIDGDAARFDNEPATNIDLPQHSGANGASARATSMLSFDDSEKTGDDGRVPSTLASIDVDDEPTGNASMPVGSDPLTTVTRELAIERTDAGAVTSSSFSVVDGNVRVTLVAGEQLARTLTGDLDVRVLLHRAPTYPVVVALFGPPAALRAPTPTQLIVVPLDVAADRDREVLTTLARQFDVAVDIVSRGRVVRRVRLAAPLAENIAYILRAANDHLRGITADGETEPSYAKSRDLVLGAGFDVLGVEHAEATEFRDDKLVTLDTAQHLRRAIAIARRFARPSREDYLVSARGYPLQRWHELRRQVLARAVAWGIWMGPELAQVAVSEGLARSRRDLIVKLDTAFEALRRDPVAFDIDADAADDNAKALAAEAKALGIELRGRKSNGAIKSEDVATVSGSIERTPTQGLPTVRTTDELIALLDDKHQRVAAATELCDRTDPRAAAPVIAAVKKMSRAEAVRILGKSVKFGPAAAGPLTEGLSSSKAFLRHGCALALALLRTDDGTHAIVEQLLNEPTEIWREIARAIGQIGPTALMPLASHVGRLGDRVDPGVAERVAWAMAHVAVRGGKSALEQMAAGQSVMAPIARQALGLHANAAQDEVRVRPGSEVGRDVTVNRAFSRRFFEALEADRPEVAQAALHDLDASGPLEVLDESDLIDEDEEEAELDESDLIHT